MKVLLLISFIAGATATLSTALGKDSRPQDGFRAGSESGGGGDTVSDYLLDFYEAGIHKTARVHYIVRFPVTNWDHEDLFDYQSTITRTCTELNTEPESRFCRALWNKFYEIDRVSPGFTLLLLRELKKMSWVGISKLPEVNDEGVLAIGSNEEPTQAAVRLGKLVYVLRSLLNGGMSISNLVGLVTHELIGKLYQDIGYATTEKVRKNNALLFMPTTFRGNRIKEGKTSNENMIEGIENILADLKRGPRPYEKRKDFVPLSDERYSEIPSVSMNIGVYTYLVKHIVKNAVVQTCSKYLYSGNWSRLYDEAENLGEVCGCDVRSPLFPRKQIIEDAFASVQSEFIAWNTIFYYSAEMLQSPCEVSHDEMVYWIKSWLRVLWSDD